MKIYLFYLPVALITVAMAYSEQCLHVCMYHLLAIIVCQPWLAGGWVLSSVGVVELGHLTPALVAILCTLNLVLGAAILYVRHRIAANRHAG
jgi:hypothetical protein